ncbi:hypothetical protein GCM10009596_12450 [Arthrobacter rhombi]|uniref:DUF349 domain-containing protein n=1 Tax=Arthrobacter rhombi TaxID=71253 RepID=UPI0031CF0039
MTSSKQSDDNAQQPDEVAGVEANTPDQAAPEDAATPTPEPIAPAAQDSDTAPADAAEASPAAAVPADDAEASPAAAVPADDAEAPAPEPAKPAAEAPRPTPAPKPAATPRPTPGAVPRPPAKPSPATATAGQQAPSAPVVPAPPAYSSDLTEAAKHSRVTEDGHVFVLVDGEEFPVGQYPDASQEEALAYFVRKHDDVMSQLLLLEQRVAAQAPAADMNKTLDHLQELVTERIMVGDLKALQARLDVVRGEVAERQKAERQAQEENRARELAAREAIVAEAETLAAQDPASVQWKQGSNRMNELFDLWKSAQKNGPRLGRPTEDALWKRFRGARTTFDRHRRAFFSQLDADNSDAKRAKEDLIARAEALSSSTDWGHTAGEYRRLMDEWKASKRASRKDDDALWARFRAAQDVFFDARTRANEEIDQEFEANLVAKEAILAEARALLPIKDLAAAKKAFEPIRDRWEAAGKVPRSAMQRMEGGMRTVEDALRDAEDEKWRRSNPETKARTNSMLSQLEDTIADLESDLETAKTSGNDRKIRDAEEALSARRAWLETLQKSAQDFE